MPFIVVGRERAYKSIELEIQSFEIRKSDDQYSGFSGEIIIRVVIQYRFDVTDEQFKKSPGCVVMSWTA
jgi:hypothetical protein